MTTSTQSETYEPPIVQGIASAAVAIGGLMLAGVSLVLFLAPPEWLTGWLRIALLPFIPFGWLLAIRFTRHDRQIAAKVATLQMDCEDYEVEVGRLETQVTALTEDVIHLRGLLANPVKSITITDRDGSRTVPMQERNQAWQDALALVRTADGDFGRLVGADKRGVSQQQQAAALRILEDAKVAVPRGTIYRLTMSRQQALDTLNSTYSPAGVNPQDAQSGQEKESGIWWGDSSGGVVSGEGV